jgi:hypothetical protein
MFMVHDPIWDSANYGPHDIACQSCLERRIGRKLTMEDYTVCPLNFMTVPGFTTDDNLRKLYAQDGMDYDKEKAAYLERCERLGLKPLWFTSESSRTPQSFLKGY